MGFRQVGDLVNIETDMVGKYVERFTEHFAKESTRGKNTVSSVDEALLEKAGFM
jgi:riboflavin synthase alpha subunit